jgi:hypothetical protein
MVSWACRPLSHFRISGIGSNPGFLEPANDRQEIQH